MTADPCTGGNGPSPSTAPVFGLGGVWVAVVFLLVVCWRINEPGPRHSGNVWSRYATIESLVERGTLAITHSPVLGNANDRIKVGDDYYSDKPPGLSVVGTGVYAVLRVFGCRMIGTDPRLAGVRFRMFNFWMVALLVALPAALGVYLFRACLGPLKLGWLTKDLLAASFGFGTLMLTYAVTFNNHVPAAVLVVGTWAVLLAREAHAERTPARAALLGFLVALAAAIDLPTGGTAAVALAIYLLVTGRSWREMVAFAAGALAPVLLHGVSQSMVTGSPLVAELYPRYWHWEPGGAGPHVPCYWLHPTGTDTNQEGAVSYLGHVLVGPRGWLTLTPAMVFGLVGLGVCLWRPGLRRRGPALLLLAMLIVVVGYYVGWATRRNYGGQSYGMRWFIALTPLVCYFGAVWHAHTRRVGWRVLFWIAVGIGVVYSVVGTTMPWSEIERSSNPVLAVLQHLVIHPWQPPPL